MSIYNTNILIINEINIKLTSVRKSKNIRDLASKSKEKVILGFILQDKHCTGEYFKETITLKISFLNKCTEQTYRLSERVEQTVVNSINKQISKGRTLDF